MNQTDWFTRAPLSEGLRAPTEYVSSNTSQSCTLKHLSGCLYEPVWGIYLYIRWADIPVHHIGRICNALVGYISARTSWIDVLMHQRGKSPQFCVPDITIKLEASTLRSGCSTHHIYFFFWNLNHSNDKKKGKKRKKICVCPIYIPKNLKCKRNLSSLYKNMSLYLLHKNFIFGIMVFSLTELI